MAKQQIERHRLNRANEQDRIARAGKLQTAARRAAERQRADLLARFERQQLETRDWISFAEIIDWRSRQGANGIPSADNERVALKDLWAEVSAGVIFYADDRSHILLTSLEYDLPDALLTNPSALPPTAWVTREKWLAWREIHPSDTINRLLKSCWGPRALCLKFAASVPFQPKPDWVREDEAQDGSVAIPSSRKRGMPEKPHRNGPRLVAWLALKEKFMDGLIPDDCPDSRLMKIVQNYMVKRPDTIEGRVRQQIDITTVRRASGRRR